MQLFFLEAAEPLTKSFIKQPDGSFEKTAYPLVKKFTSHVEDVKTIDDLYKAVNKHAALNRCMLKGNLRKPLLNETRAGTTSQLDPTSFIVFDLDNITGINNAEGFVHGMLPPEFRDVSYVLQYSASSGIMPEQGVRAHLFFMLDEPVLPEVLKNWLTQLNLSNDTLKNQLTLSSNAMTVKFTLDRTVVQNDKLIYIAPPICGNFTDPLEGKRIQLITKTKGSLTFAQTVKMPTVIQNELAACVDALRENAGLVKRKAKFKTIDGVEILANPDVGIVTGEKRDRQWVRLNVNGGDSWAYYFDPLNPRILHNFKGEPDVILRDFLPNYWAELQQRVHNPMANDPNTILGDRPFAFRHMATDNYYNGIFDPINHRIVELHKTQGGKRLNDFFAQYSMAVPDPIEDWTYEFRPDDDRIIDFNARFCNIWQPTELMKTAQAYPHVPPTIQRVLWSVVGDDKLSYDRFLNWLACIYQLRMKTMTAWVFHGVQGTGKGTLFNRVLAPIFGHHYAISKTLANLEDQFNSYIEQSLILNVDEVRVSNATNAQKLLNSLKNMITEPTLTIRAMRTDPRSVPSFTNFVFTSNDYDAMNIDPTDRRFNIAPRQEKRLWLSEKDIADIHKEVPHFAGFLKQYAIDKMLAMTAIDNVPKTLMREASMDAIDQMCYALQTGDLMYFAKYLESEATLPTEIVAYSSFTQAVKRWVKGAGKAMVVPRSELMAAYIYLHAPPKPPGPEKFQRMLSHRSVLINDVHKCELAGEEVRGLPVIWKATSEQLADLQKLISPTRNEQMTGASHG